MSDFFAAPCNKRDEAVWLMAKNINFILIQNDPNRYIRYFLFIFFMKIAQIGSEIDLLIAIIEWFIEIFPTDIDLI